MGKFLSASLPSSKQIPLQGKMGIYNPGVICPLHSLVPGSALSTYGSRLSFQFHKTMITIPKARHT